LKIIYLQTMYVLKGPNAQLYDFKKPFFTTSATVSCYIVKLTVFFLTAATGDGRAPGELGRGGQIQPGPHHRSGTGLSNDFWCFKGSL
jgi:hypothetical protein